MLTVRCHAAVKWRPHLREPHESTERGEQRPDNTGFTGLVAQDVLEGVGLEREGQAGDVVAQLSCERHVGDGVNVLDVVGHVDAPGPSHRMRADPTENVPIVSKIPRMTGGHTNGLWLPHLGKRQQATCHAAAKRGCEAYHRSSMTFAANVGSPMLRRTMTAMVV